MSDEPQTEPQPTPTFSDLIKQADEKIANSTAGDSGIPESETPAGSLLPLPTTGFISTSGSVPKSVEREVEAHGESQLYTPEDFKQAMQDTSGTNAVSEGVETPASKDKRLKADLVVENESLRQELAAIKVELASRPPIVMHGDTPVGNFDNLKSQNEVANPDAPTPPLTPPGREAFSLLSQAVKMEEELAFKIHEAYEDYRPSWMPSYTWDALEKEMCHMFEGMAHAAVQHLFGRGNSGIPEDSSTGVA